MTPKEGKKVLLAMAQEGLTAVEARQRLPDVPRATFYRWAKGIDWPKHKRSEETRQKHAQSVRQTLIQKGQNTVVDVGNGPQTLREVSIEQGIPYSTLRNRYLKNRPLLQEA